MRTKIATLIFVCSCYFILGQDVLSSAQTIVIYNADGDPINNVIRANGAKHGVWTYKDFNDQVFLKQVFNNNTLVSSYFSFENGAEGSWINVQGYQNLNAMGRSFLRGKIIEHFENYIDKQVAIIRSEGELKTIFVGEWTVAETSQFTVIIEQLLAQNTYESISNFYIYVD